MKANILFFEKDGKIHFSIPDNPDLEKAVRSTVKRDTSPMKSEYYFKRGIIDAAASIEQKQPRKFGTPVVEVKNPFTGEVLTTSCQEARSLLHDVGGNYQIRQVGGTPLQPNYFTNE